jgi:predicted membrane protein
VALVLIAGSTLNGIPTKIGNYSWHPVNAAEAAQEYTVGIGQGELDLSDVALKAGTRASFSASVSLGQIIVIVPPTARVEVHGYARLGEVQIDNKVEGGADVTFDYVLKPAVDPTGDVATLELNVKAGFGDVEVRRAA